MPTPAGTGLNRRSFLLRSGAALLSVYGASKLRFADLEEGIAQAAGGSERVLVSIFLDGGVDSLSVLAPTADPLYRSLRPSLALPAGRRAPRSPRTRACAGTRAAPRSTRCTAPARSRCCPASATRAPTSRTSPRATTGRSARCDAERGHRLDGPAARRDRHRRQPAPGAVARRLALAGAGDRERAGGGDRRPVLRPLGGGRLGRAGGADVRVPSASSAAPAPHEGRRPALGRRAPPRRRWR